MEDEKQSELELDGLQIPETHTAIKANSRLMDDLARIRLKGYSEEEIKNKLEEMGYQPSTIQRFIRGVNLRLESHHKIIKKQRVSSRKRDSSGRFLKTVPKPTPEEIEVTTQEAQPEIFPDSRPYEEPKEETVRVQSVLTDFADFSP